MSRKLNTTLSILSKHPAYSVIASLALESHCLDPKLSFKRTSLFKSTADCYDTDKVLYNGILYANMLDMSFYHITEGQTNFIRHGHFSLWNTCGPDKNCFITNQNRSKNEAVTKSLRSCFSLATFLGFYGLLAVCNSAIGVKDIHCLLPLDGGFCWKNILKEASS